MSFTDTYGIQVFSDRVMQQRLSAQAYNSYKQLSLDGGTLTRDVADEIACAMKDWAIENGATHFTHWFQPMTGMTAEKHEAFIRPDGDCALAVFSGKELIKGESDASSFPSGGLRATFEARGYTAWDPTSYAFIKDKTLCVPTAFCSYTGEALDKKTPLMRSMRLLNASALKLLARLGVRAQRVSAMVGAEQEYFLIDKELYRDRPDLIYTGRTLLGRRPSKGQELDDHFFGALKPRVSAFMRELDEELWKLGIPAKTCHNEAAPAQHELACVYESVNVAVDHNQLTMEMMKRIASRHGLVCLLHEKPFKGVNGSGKHNNWSLQTDEGMNLLEPGDKPWENPVFLLMLCAMIRGVDKYAELLRVSVASAGNDLRLGGDEAPPAIISMYLGDDLCRMLSDVANGQQPGRADREFITGGVDTLSPVMKDTSDRNRTSPVAFTGNKFEFRAVGSSFSVADINVIINTAVADSMEFFAAKLDECESIESGVREIVRQTLEEHGRILFNGNNYSLEWAKEAQRRGLPRLDTTVDALKRYCADENLSLLTRHSVLSRTEIISRREIMLENYSKIVAIEAHTLIDMLRRGVMPAAQEYTRRLADGVLKKQQAGVGPSAEMHTLSSLNSLCNQLYDACSALDMALDEAEGKSSEMEKAECYCEKVLPLMKLSRGYSDEAEALCPLDVWPYPDYGSLLSGTSV
ncbi:MAG: glutamine synthetase III [Clostridiales bacterium]|nr:glutamine synthetase III [Clostridiales bacterium]